VKESDRDLKDVSLVEMEELYQAGKQLEEQNSSGS